MNFVSIEYHCSSSHSLWNEFNLHVILISRDISIKMEFFEEKRNYIVCFLFFGLWSTWNKSKYTILFKIYSIFLLSLVFGSFFSAIIFNQFFEHLTLSATVATFLFITILLAHLIIVIESLYKSNLQEKLIKKFSFVDQMLSTEMGKRLPYCQEKRNLFVQNCMIVSTVFLLKISVVVYTYYRDTPLNFMYTAMYSSWIIRLRSLQVLFFVYLIRNRLIMINDELINFRNHSNQKPSLRFVGNSENCNPKLLEFERLVNIKIIFKNLCDICELVSRAFGMSLLAIFTQSFIDFTCNCYWVFYTLENTPSDYGAILMCISFLIQNIVTLIILTFYCSSCSHHVRLIGIDRQ